MRLDDTIAEAAVRAAASHTEWEQKHHPVCIDGKTREEPMPIEVKRTRGEISFRHPDSQRWVRERRLGSAFTLQNLGIAPPARSSGYGRSFQEILQK